MSGDDSNVQNELLFLQVVSMFQVAALQQMGKLPNPVTNEIERDLEQAKVSVDILGMFKEKTKGNLSEHEEEFLGRALFESQMNYLDEAKKSGDESPEKAEGKTQEQAAGETEETAESSDGEKSEPALGEEGEEKGDESAKGQ